MSPRDAKFGSGTVTVRYVQDIISVMLVKVMLVQPGSAIECPPVPDRHRQVGPPSSWQLKSMNLGSCRAFNNFAPSH